jgi:hypothetical protein
LGLFSIANRLKVFNTEKNYSELAQKIRFLVTLLKQIAQTKRAAA